MYISKELIFQIAYIIITLIHIVLYLILFYKLHKVKGGKPMTVNDLKNKAIELSKSLLNPNNSIISGVIEFIHNQGKADNAEQPPQSEEDNSAHV